MLAEQLFHIWQSTAAWCLSAFLPIASWWLLFGIIFAPLLHFCRTFVALFPPFKGMICSATGVPSSNTPVYSLKVQVVTSPRNLHRKEKVKLWVSSGIPGKRKWKLVNLSATMLSTEFAAVGQIFADEQPADAFYGWAASCFIDGTKKGFSNCLDSWLHQTVSPQLAKTSSYSWAECHVKVDTLPDLRQCNLSTQRSRDSVENCHNFGTKANDWEQPKSVSFSLEISNLPFSSSTLDLEGVLIRVESSPSCTDARQVDGDTNTSAPTIFDTVWPVFFWHPPFLCSSLLFLWPQLLARHNLKLSYFLFWLTCRWLLPPSPSLTYLPTPLTLLWAPWAPVWRVVGSTRTVQASLTLDGVEALLYLFNPWSQRPLKVLLLRMQWKYDGGMINGTPPS